MKGSLRVAGLLLATAVATTALPAALPGVAVAASGIPAAPAPTSAAHGAGQGGSDPELARLLDRLTRLDLLQRLGVLKKMNAKYPGIGAFLDRLQAISVTELLGQSIPASPENKSATNQLADPTYRGAMDGFRARPKHKVLKESVD
ncbi:hypothetical protein [Actinomadura sp. 6N118]|uniref:hypothetical protein n=1 Tax=Actinomadura sp. 6N118 TaxID=3375151 RepID=UPI00378DB51A